MPMKIEADENVTVSATICVIAIVIAAISMHGCRQVEETKREAYKAGLEEVQIEGSTVTRLSKSTAR